MLFSVFSSKKEKEEIERERAGLIERKRELDRISEYEMIHMVPIDRICQNPWQPRSDFEDGAIIRLADSIRQHGVLQPLTVRRISDDSASVGAIYSLIAGERRLRALKLLGRTTAPCIVCCAGSEDCAELALIENLQRQDLNVFEQASAISALIERHEMTRDEVADKLSISRSAVSNKLRLLQLTPEEREIIIRNSLTERHARALLRVEDEDERLAVLKQIIDKKLNVAATEDYIERCITGEKLAGNTGGQRRKLILKDIRIFYNSIDRAVDTVRQSGLNIESEKNEHPNEYEVIIRIPKPNRTAEAKSISDAQ